jgi:hypothetical protein
MCPGEHHPRAAKRRNLLGNQKVSLLVVDPRQHLPVHPDPRRRRTYHPRRREHLDALTRKYTGYPAYYGYIYPEAQRLRETRVIYRIHPRRITLDAIHIAGH